MKLLLLALLLVSACAHRTGEDGRARGFEPAASTADELARTLQPRRMAILVGVDVYQDPVFPALRHAEADANALADVLADPRGGAFDEVVRLTGPEHTKRLDLFEALREARSLRREDTLVVYFSGHGTRVADAGRWRRFLLTSDSRARDLEGSAVDLAQLQEFFSTLPPLRKALVLDACFSGDGKSVVRPEAPPPGAVPTPSFAASLGALQPGEAHLYATSAGRPSRESDKLAHGVYTYYLLEALSWGFAEADLDRDGVITAWEAHDFARGRTVGFTDGVQVPEAALRVVGDGDVVLAGTEERRKRREDALVYLYAGEEHELSGARVLVDGRPRGALPGTVSVRSGRHRIELVTEDGERLVDGSVTLGSGRAYRVEDLQRIAEGPSHLVGLRATWFTSPPLETSLGGGAGGLELYGVQRAARGPVRGMYGTWALGTAVSPTRGPAEDRVKDSRSLAWASGGMGYQVDLARLRTSVGGGLSVWHVPPDFDGERPEGKVDPALVPGEAGWFIGAFGPEAGLGWVLSDAWALTAHGRAHFAALDVDGDGASTAVPLVTASLGAQASW